MRLLFRYSSKHNTYPLCILDNSHSRVGLFGEKQNIFKIYCQTGSVVSTFFSSGERAFLSKTIYLYPMKFEVAPNSDPEIPPIFTHNCAFVRYGPEVWKNGRTKETITVATMTWMAIEKRLIAMNLLNSI